MNVREKHGFSMKNTAATVPGAITPDAEKERVSY